MISPRNAGLLTASALLIFMGYTVNIWLGFLSLPLLSGLLLSHHFNQPQQPLKQNIFVNKSLSAKLEELIENQQNSYNNVFLKNPNTFHQPTFHYDWWMFPQEAPNFASETSRKFSVNDQEVKNLLRHNQFITTYEKSIKKYLDNLEEHGWNHYDIRYAKMVISLHKFICVSEQHNMTDMNKRLKNLAQRAIKFAQNNIKHPSGLLQQGLAQLMKEVNVSKKTPKFTPRFNNKESNKQKLAFPHTSPKKQFRR